MTSALGTFDIAEAGHVASWRSPAGRVLSRCHDGFISGNDPAFGGIGAVCWHHYRANGEPDFWRRSWEINPSRVGAGGVVDTQVVSPPHDIGNGRMAATLEATYGDPHGPVARTRHSYVIGPKSLRLTVTVTTGRIADFPAFVKEPKIVVGFCVPLRTATVRDDRGSVLGRYDLTTLHDPTQHTYQARSPLRNSVRFDPGGIVVSARTGRGRWTPSHLGLDGWAQVSNTRARLDPLGVWREHFGTTDARPMPHYCSDLDGGLRRYWEIIKRGDDQTALLLKGWEGGVGLEDCLGNARAFGPEGESWTNVITVTRGAP